MIEFEIWTCLRVGSLGLICQCDLHMIEARGLFNMTSQKVPTVSSSRTCLITPATPTPLAQLKLPLSPLDLILPSFYTPVILVYASLGHHSFQTALNNFKSTLSKTLVAFYPLAGRLVKGEDGVPIIMCNDAGAYLTEVVVEEGLESLGGQQVLPLFTGMEATNLGSAGWYSCDQHAEIPPLVLQVLLFHMKPCVCNKKPLAITKRDSCDQHTLTATSPLNFGLSIL